MSTKVSNGLDLQSQRIISVADPSSAQDAATKAYVDAIAAGLAWKKEVVVATTTNGTLATAYANGQTIDGYVLVTGDRILLKNQTTQTENGIYTVNSAGAPTRAVDVNTTAGLQSATVSVVKGTVGKDTAWTQNTDDVVVGTSNVVFVSFGAGTTYLAGNGLTGTTTFTVLAQDTSLDVGASGVRVGSGALLTNGGLQGGSGTAVSVKNTTGVSVGASGVGVDYSVVAMRYSALIGDGSSLSYVVTHGLSNKNVSVSLWEDVTGNAWLPDVTARTLTTVTLNFAVAPTTNAMRVLVQ